MFNNICELAVYQWGLEDVRTVAVCTIFEKMGEGQATVLYCYLCDGSDDQKSEDNSYDDEWDDADLEMGFDSYSGCYDFDC